MQGPKTDINTTMTFPIIEKSRIWYMLSGALVAASIVSLLLWRLNFGIDFTGGSLLAVEFTKERPAPQQILDTLKPLNLGEIILQNSAERGINLRFKEVDDAGRKNIVSALTKAFP